MELWLLGAGAIVLIAITLWIVWPARTAESDGATVPIKEDRSMSEYTSATADLSAGGVATAVDAMQNEPPTPTPPVTPSHRWSPPAAGDDYSSPLSPPAERSLVEPRKLGLGAGALLSLGGAVGGAWLYARWQRERNKPINRLRRGARDVASRLGERVPDVEDLPRGAAPMSGAATALLLTGLLASRVMRRNANDSTDDLRDEASGFLERGRETAQRGRHLVERGRKESRRLAARLPIDELQSQAQPQRPAIMGLGFGGLAVVAGGAYLVWRMLRGSKSPNEWTSRRDE